MLSPGYLTGLIIGGTVGAVGGATIALFVVALCAAASDADAAPDPADLPDVTPITSRSPLPKPMRKFT